MEAKNASIKGAVFAQDKNMTVDNKRQMMNVSRRFIILITAAFCLLAGFGVRFTAMLAAQGNEGTHPHHAYGESVSIKSVNGKLYAYIVLLFNENPHFVNMIQKDSIPLRIMGQEGFHIKEYKSYLNTIWDQKTWHLANLLLSVYTEPKKYDSRTLRAIEEMLMARNIILKFSKDSNPISDRITLDYCIFGRRKEITVKHPFFEIKEPIYNIEPYIYYDEFSTSNSTFYFDMIYINPAEVENDSYIARRIIEGQSANSLFFVGSQITDDIKYCLTRAFTDKASIKAEIKKMFIIHELTHKVLNNKYNNFDQVQGEELSLGSTIYANPMLGLAVLYSYLNYNAINPHRIAAMNFVKFVSRAAGKPEYIDNPGLIKYLPLGEIQNIAKKHFFSIVRTVK